MNTSKIVQVGFGEQVYRRLKKMILSGELEPGEKIPEGKIASMYNVSRTPIREAIRKLNDYGLVETYPRSYSIVTKISPEQARSIGEFRAELEKFAIHLLFQKERFDEKLLHNLQKISDECIELMEKMGARDLAFEKDTDFHHLLIKAAGNEYLYEAYERLDASIQLVRLNMHVTPETFVGYIEQHYGILDMIRQKNEHRAIELIDHHIYRAFMVNSSHIS